MTVTDEVFDAYEDEEPYEVDEVEPVAAAEDEEWVDDAEEAPEETPEEAPEPPREYPDISQFGVSDADEPEPVASEDEFDDGRRWYVVHCYSGYENKVRHAIEQRTETMDMEDKIFDVIVPTEEEIEIKDGKRRTVERRVFPGYVLVQMIMDEDSWYVVRNTPGVTGFVGMGNKPTPLSEAEVVQIMRRMEADAPSVKVSFKPGERVRIIDGPFNDIPGTVEEIDMERAKVRVMVSFFGRETPVELDFLQVEKT
jgi:transcriptional antiterminator NusG